MKHMMVFGHVPLYYIVLVIDISDFLKRIHAALMNSSSSYQHVEEQDLEKFADYWIGLSPILIHSLPVTCIPSRPL